MQRISSRLATAIIALALLIIPVSAQAAPSNSDTTAWGASVVSTFGSWLDAAWDAVEGIFVSTPEDEAPTSAPIPLGGEDSQSSSDDDGDTIHSLDPNG